MNSFKISATQGFARAGQLELAHGSLHTPAFMPVGTHGTVKTLSPDELKQLGTQILLGNTYHLYLRPGLEVLERLGGLHRFMHWDRPILTDSGGFQVFSLGKLKRVTDEGVLFQSHLDGDMIFLTPELSAKIQQVIGSDIAMVLDECVALPNTLDVLEQAVVRSLHWARGFFSVPRRADQQIFGILQGGTSFDLRMQSLEGTLALPIDGLAVGGLSVGEPHSIMVETLTSLAPCLPPALPHYLMGVGTPRDLLESVRLGIDMFDCVLPTRNARNGGFFTDEGLLNIRNEKYRLDPGPIEENCSCPCCRDFSRAYLRHLFQSKEILGCRLATIHNVHYYHRLMRGMREAILVDAFEAFYLSKKELFARSYPSRGEEKVEGEEVI